MKKAILFIVTVLCLGLTARAQQNTAFQPGPMAINSWTGQLTVGGVITEKELWDRYFSPEDLASFKTGKIMNDVGGIIACVGAFPLGYGLGYTLGWNARGGSSEHASYKSAQTMMWVGLGVMAVGLAVGIPGSIKMKNAIRNYNSALTCRSELRFGSTPNGVGLAFIF